MRRASLIVMAIVSCGAIVDLLLVAACGSLQGQNDSGGFTDNGPASGGASASGSATGSGIGGSAGAGSGSAAGGAFDGGSLLGDGSAPSGTMVVDAGGVACPAGLKCNVSCASGTRTTITGKVYDPAAQNPLYNVAVYVPATPLQALPLGVPTGADKCSCAALFKSGAVTSTTTDVDGSFTLTNVPVGANVPLVLQVGKWRRALHVKVAACKANAQPDRSLTLPGSLTGAGPDDNMPQIAVSTGGADTLECLMRRIGLPATEFVPGAVTGGHVHVYSGGDPNLTGNNHTELPPMPGAPASDHALWASQSQLMPYDITLLSCEGGETYDANPAALEAYLNAGGRAFASHYHYSWFTGPLNTAGAGPGYTYQPPADWGMNLANWVADNGGGPMTAIGATIDTMLNGAAGSFHKGMALQQWLSGLGALGTDGVPPGDLAIYQPRYNAVVGAGNKVAQPWITTDPNGMGMQGQTMYFSFDTPVNAAPAADGGAPQYCGRAVFSDLHVRGAIMDMNPPPDGCLDMPLSPQEKALEFMLFDLSSCVIPDTVQPPAEIPQ